MRPASLLIALVSLLNAADNDFFEKEVRPLLAENCHACHSAKVKSPFGGILLDSRAAVLDGSLVVPGKPDESRLIKAKRR